jgi:sigma-70-like protein
VHSPHILGAAPKSTPVRPNVFVDEDAAAVSGCERKQESARPKPKRLQQNHPGESATRTMTIHPDQSQDVPMATTVDLGARSVSPRPPRDQALAARFVNNALPYLTQLDNRARRMTHTAVDAEDLIQETMLKAYAGFNTLSEDTNIRAWLFRIMSDTYINGLRRAQHRPSEYLVGHITDRQLAAVDQHSSQGPRSAPVRWYRGGPAVGFHQSRLWALRTRPPSSLFFAQPDLGDLR